MGLIETIFPFLGTSAIEDEGDTYGGEYTIQEGQSGEPLNIGSPTKREFRSGAEVVEEFRSKGYWVMDYPSCLVRPNARDAIQVPQLLAAGYRLVKNGNAVKLPEEDGIETEFSTISVIGQIAINENSFPLGYAYQERIERKKFGGFTVGVCAVNEVGNFSRYDFCLYDYGTENETWEYRGSEDGEIPLARQTPVDPLKLPYNLEQQTPTTEQAFRFLSFLPLYYEGKAFTLDPWPVLRNGVEKRIEFWTGVIDANGVIMTKAIVPCVKIFNDGSGYAITEVLVMERSDRPGVVNIQEKIQ